MRAARGSAEVAAFRALCEAYARSLPIIAVSLAHQGFEREMAGLPGAYGPPTGEIVLAWDADGTPVGCAALRPLPSEADAGASDGERRVCELKRMFVRPEARGRGIGGLLGEAIVSVARAAGYHVMRLDTDRSMTAAIAVYRGLGFRERGPYNTDPCPDTLWFELALA